MEKEKDREREEERQREKKNVEEKWKSTETNGENNENKMLLDDCMVMLENNLSFRMMYRLIRGELPSLLLLHNANSFCLECDCSSVAVAFVHRWRCYRLLIACDTFCMSAQIHFPFFRFFFRLILFQCFLFRVTFHKLNWLQHLFAYALPPNVNFQTSKHSHDLDLLVNHFETTLFHGADITKAIYENKILFHVSFCSGAETTKTENQFSA